ncbi:unnamed protein product [Brassicogethes aeneus]|uniref:Uncharacterized protein n=1 Tax=Brassicogethes aeneus TaxID=1431903 RepID=A0A9P0BEP1_BRAAE|nr:unnamed protein product [Brassicogethes aeneus]
MLDAWANVHHNMSVSRRAVIMPHLSSQVKTVSKDQPVGEVLFGENLGEKVKAAKALERKSMVIKASTSRPDIFLPKFTSNKIKLQNTSSKNFKTPKNFRTESRSSRGPTSSSKNLKKYRQT